MNNEEPFLGTIGRVMGASESWWPPRARAEGKPNVVIVLVDDVGFSDIGCFGAEIATPNLDALAETGLRFTNFHVNPMCSPTRASLLTGLNCHNVGFGHVANSDPGFPGYFCELPENVSTLAEILRDAGYATLMSGKWHLARDADISAAGPKHSWPCQRGFDRFYGILDAFTNSHHPHYLVEDNHVVDIDRYPEGYYLTDDLTDRAVRMIKERKATDPGQPFFLYLALPSAHAPLHAKEGDIARYAETYHGGWDVVRAARHASQIAWGVMPEGTVLPPRNSEPGAAVTAWADLPEDQRRLYARYMAVYAAMVDNIDQNIGRLRDALQTINEWDNTILLFLSDNGASREGEAIGTMSYYTHLRPLDTGLTAPLATDLAWPLEDIGGPRTMPHYPQGWAMAGNTPFRLYKTYAHAGGHQVPAILHWPAGISPSDHGSIRRQYQHAIDVVPTVLELLDLSTPEERHGAPVKAIQGSSFAALLKEANAPSTRPEQHYELGGHRAFMRDGWEVVTLHQRLTPFTDEEWELYDLDTDPTQVNDRADEMPGRVRELADGWERAARANQVYPLDEGSGYRWVTRAPYVENFEKPITLWPGTPTLEPWRSRRLIWMRSFQVHARFALNETGQQGVLVAHGDQGGGYVLYVEDGEVRFAFNDAHGGVHRIVSGRPVPIGKPMHATLDVDAPGGRIWNMRLTVDGSEVGELVGQSAPFPMAPFEGIDVGIDRRSPVSWDLYQRYGPFPFTGTLEWVRYEPGESSPDAPSTMLPFIRQMAARFA